VTESQSRNGITASENNVLANYGYDLLKRGTFTSVDDLVTAIELWAEHWNDDPKPFVWQKPAEAIIAKVTWGRPSLASNNSATHH
jgi:hypothetical protein